jgi:thiamine biosynthesis lipoprotein
VTVNRTTTSRIVGALACAVLLLAACDKSAGPLPTGEFAGSAMGTTYAVTVVGARTGTAGGRRAQGCIDDVLAKVERHLSTYAASSEISALNRNRSDDWIRVSDALFAVIAAGHRVSVESGGAFDITVSPLVRLWGFGANGLRDAAPELPPSPEFIHDAAAATGYTWLELRSLPDRAVRKARAPLELDVNGIAPGYAVDRISGCLTRAGSPSHLVELGGEVRAAGKRADGGSWRVAIERPVPGARQAYVGVTLSDLAISTSGNYRDFQRLPDGRTISHTIDPRTGEPVRHALASVTVVHARAELADAYATALMVLGLDEGYAFAQRLGLPALFLERIGQSQQFRERATPEFEPLRSGPAR